MAVYLIAFIIVTTVSLILVFNCYSYVIVGTFSSWTHPKTHKIIPKSSQGMQPHIFTQMPI